VLEDIGESVFFRNSDDKILYGLVRRRSGGEEGGRKGSKRKRPGGVARGYPWKTKKIPRDQSWDFGA
jgi:hypothetical protein